MQSTALLGAPREWCKEIAALATAEGGHVVFGVVESKPDRLAEALDQGLTLAQMSAERLEDLTHGNLSPPVEGLQVSSIQISSDGEPRFAYVVTVPASDAAPHMVEHRYYMRDGSHSRPMEDYLVRSVMTRRTVPALVLHHRFEGSGERKVIRFSIENVGRVGAEDIYLEIEFSADAKDPNWHPVPRPPVLQQTVFEIAGKRWLRLSWAQTDVPTRQGGGAELSRLPPLLYPGMTHDVPDFVIVLKGSHDPDGVLITRLYARDMPVVEKTVALDGADA